MDPVGQWREEKPADVGGRAGLDAPTRRAPYALSWSGGKDSALEEIAFGELFLRDVRAYRERQCTGVGRRARFPLWGRDTRALAERFLALGFRARIVCLDPQRVPPERAGREYDERLLAELPDGVDPCGENGEFHTFVHDGPVFRAPVSCRRGEIVERDGFVFADLLPDR
jgi:diphthamide synthase (EF-2-diphthine--ammonia ligase)